MPVNLTGMSKFSLETQRYWPSTTRLARGNSTWSSEADYSTSSNPHGPSLGGRVRVWKDCCSLHAAALPEPEATFLCDALVRAIGNATSNAPGDRGSA